MKKTNVTYSLFHFACLLVISTAIFFDKCVLVYVKPIVPFTLSIVYLKLAKKPNILFPLLMLIIIAIDVLIYQDLMKHYTAIAILGCVFYGLCMYLLKGFVTKNDIKPRLLFAPQAVVSVVLIGYLVYSLIELILPKMMNSLVEMTFLITALLLFVAICFFIYAADRYDKAIYLFIAACCTLFVDGLVTINELYYYNKVFTVLVNIIEMTGLYFLTAFLLETKLLDKNQLKDKYF